MKVIKDAWWRLSSIHIVTVVNKRDTHNRRLHAFQTTNFNTILSFVIGSSESGWKNMLAGWLPLLLLLCRSCLVQSGTGFHYVWLLFCCMEWDPPSVIYFIPQKSVCVLLKTNFHAFDALLCYFLFVLLVFHKLLEAKICVLCWKLNVVFVAVMLISINCEHPDWCFCLHHFVIQKRYETDSSVKLWEL